MAFDIDVTFTGLQVQFEGQATINLDSLFKLVGPKQIKYITGLWIQGEFYDNNNAKFYEANTFGWLESTRKANPDNYTVADTTPMAPATTAITKRQWVAMAGHAAPWKGRIQAEKSMILHYKMPQNPIQPNVNDICKFRVLIEIC